MVYKAELHAHLEGTLSPQKFLELASKNKISIPENILSKDKTYYHWEKSNDPGQTLMAFVTTYDKATAVIQTPEDYYDITLDYLKRCAQQNSIYQELIIYANPEPIVGISYKDMIDAIADAIDHARDSYDIECRLLASLVRHFGIEQSMKDAKTVTSYPHKYVTGITLSGAETSHQIADFVPAYHHITDELGLQKTAHAGEVTGPQTIKQCYELLGITRFGHMVRITENPDLLKKMVEIGAVAEVCPSSNIALGLYPDYESHPLKTMYDAGLSITINSDDPPFFKTDLEREYHIAQNLLGVCDETMTHITQNAINAAFVDETTREKLLHKINHVIPPLVPATI